MVAGILFILLIIFFNIIRNITEKGGEGAAAVPLATPLTPPPAPYSLKSDDYSVKMLSLPFDDFDNMWIFKEVKDNKTKT